jgi:hypothetical protein
VFRNPLSSILHDLAWLLRIVSFLVNGIWCQSLRGVGIHRIAAFPSWCGLGTARNMIRITQLQRLREGGAGETAAVDLATVDPPFDPHRFEAAGFRGRAWVPVQPA